jgi:hydrogenase maturation protein HypF
MQVRQKIDVAGIVQGVGFRPYIYRLAAEQQLVGSICNTASGVTIEVQGPPELVAAFVTRLPREAPPLARITAVQVGDLPTNGDTEFRIVATQRGEPVKTLISPDVAVCDDCLREMRDPLDRRHRYPFINCTNCGPRFTIVRDIPYDRPHTSMAAFRMCAACQAEYDDPLNRRFHAQPNACWRCGPRLEFWNEKVNREYGCDPIAAAVKALHAGKVVAVKGLGGFHFAVDATSEEAVQLLRERKRRVEKPFAVMVPDLDTAAYFCEVGDAGSAALMSVQRPIVLAPWRRPGPLADAVAPFNRYLGVFLPYTPIQHLLFADGEFSALVMTSANLSEEPIVIDNREALARLNGLADCFLMHNRDILLRCDDSVVRTSAGKVRQMRRSRGFVPVPVFLKDDLPPVLAAGGELKNTICLTKGSHAFLSQHVGDLENAESYKFFEEAITHLKNVLEIEPEIIAYDLHPGYFSTQWAQAQTGVKLEGVQHHHAHIAGCMAENQLEGRVIGFALDGTGYGSDGRIWGGEVLLCDYQGFERAAHFEYVPLPGGDAAIREPWRMGVSYLSRHYGSDFAQLDIPFTRQLEHDKVKVLLRMMEREVNSPLTSSCGRLFDAVAAVCGVRQKVNYEAQAAIELEMAIGEASEEGAYPLDLITDGPAWQIATRPLFDALLSDVSQQTPLGRISARFHNGLVEVFTRLARLLRERESLNRVCLSGGTFHNVYLCERLHASLLRDSFEVFSHSEVPAGDGGLSLGQAVIAASRQG